MRERERERERERIQLYIFSLFFNEYINKRALEKFYLITKNLTRSHSRESFRISNRYFP